MQYRVKNGELPSALIRALEYHFIYDRERNTHLRHIPSFIEKAIYDVKSDPFSRVYILKRFTGKLLGYILKESENEFTIFIPCQMEERGEILFLINDSILKQELENTSYALKVVFIGFDTQDCLFHTVLFSGIASVYLFLRTFKTDTFILDFSRFINVPNKAIFETYCKPFVFPSFWKKYNPIKYSFSNTFLRGHHNEVVDDMTIFLKDYYLPTSEEIRTHIVINN
jgi:hypothetical protein